MKTVLVLGGTTEARELTNVLAAGGGVRVVYSLAGRVPSPVLPSGAEVRIGGFGGADAMQRWLRRERVCAVVDATHPFAIQVSANAIDAAASAGVPLIALRRPSWERSDDDVWHVVSSLADAPAALERFGDRVFLTTGRQGLHHFADVDRWFLVRCVSAPDPPMPRRMTLLLERGPFTLDGELGVMRTHRVDVLVTKDSGGRAAAAKLAAARTLRLPVVLVARPHPSDGSSVSTADAAAAWVIELLDAGPR